MLERSAAHHYAGPAARVLVWFGMVVMGALALVGIGWTLLFVAVVALAVRNHRMLRRGQWRIEAGPDADFAFGARRDQRIRLADLGGVIVVHVPAATSRGLPITREREQWRLVGHDGSTIGVADTAGLDPDQVRQLRARLDVPFVPLPIAARADILPADTPWWVRHEGRALALGIVIAVAVMVAVIAAPSYWG